MAGPVSRAHAALGDTNLNDSPYSLIPERLGEVAQRNLQSHGMQPVAQNDDVYSRSYTNGDFDNDRDDDDDDEDVENEIACDDLQRTDGVNNYDNAGCDEREVSEAEEAGCALADPPWDMEKARNLPMLTKSLSGNQVDIAQIRKKQAFLRGGGDENECNGVPTLLPSALDADRTKSSSKKKKRQPGVLEAIFLPKTFAAAHSKTNESRSSMAVRRHTRRSGSSHPHQASASTSTNVAEQPTESPRSGSSLKSKAVSKESKPPVATPSAGKSSTSSSTKAECVSCLDEVSKQRSALLKCKHRMCHTCLKRLFVLSTEDPQLMPPKCCTDEMIPLRHVERLLNTAFKITWNRKYAEYTTKHRLYCPSKNCGEWIKPKYIETDPATGRKFGKCKKCKTKVCKKCGLKWHGGRYCENDEATRQVLDLGKEMGWQRCYNCRAMVQLSEGCNHMRCRCNAEFCMLCAQKWKTCDCPWFNVPPEFGVEEFLDPGQGFPAAPLDLRIGNLHPPPPPPPPPVLPGFLLDTNPLPQLLPPNPFRDRRDMPFDPLNPGDIFRPPRVDRSRNHRRRTFPAIPLTSQEQETADEELARQLQEQELTGRDTENDDDRTRRQRRANRQSSRTSYILTEDHL
ncbi:uncharacterized protein PV09_01417 [Verruconis gallopava]|uniref:RBR-type E3 ubiquitin transferase n=1 Tax=Verruconis gallopava TaxID=253628 RepID=A0A0D1Z6G8_9PEZI|nr:uncharacterized protein PV09_01417 [Verruconis gallopava]KIW08527.1 hypothetical protein PV09_01417 [Verruconis gallopava]